MIKCKSGEVASIRIQQNYQHFIDRGKGDVGEVWNGWLVLAQIYSLRRLII